MTDRHLAEIHTQTIEHCPDAVLTVDCEECIVLFNAAAEQLWGRPREAVLGRPVMGLLPQLLQHRAEGSAPLTQDVLIERHDGSRRWGSMNCARIEIAEKVLYTAFIKDITEQRREVERTHLLSLAADRTDSAVIITDGQWRILYVNNGFSTLFGYSQAESLGRTPAPLIAAHQLQTMIEALRERLSNGLPYHAEELVQDRHGQRIWCSVTSNPVFDENGRLINTVSLLTDITDSKIHQVLQHQVLEAMVREVPLGEVMALVCREVEHIAPQVVASIQQVDEHGTLHPLAAPSLPVAYSQALEGCAIGPFVGSCGTAAFRQQPVLVTDIRNDPLWADYRHMVPEGLRACWSTPIMSSDGRVIGTFAFYYRESREPSALHRRLVDVSAHLCALALEREETRSRIRQITSYDGLTGLPNRSLLHARAERAIDSVAQARGSLAVLFIDLDRFKQINDSLGHPCGDELLRIIAERLKQERLSGDIIGRLSGDEFVLVCPFHDGAQATDLAEHLQQRLAEPCLVGGGSLTPSASIGIALYPEDGRDMEQLLQHADLAMGQAKAAGRGCFSFFSHEMNRLAQERMALEAALKAALLAGELHLHYQPQVNFADGSLHGVEALARWRHPQLGEVSPARFIPLAEECGLIDALGDWALNEACRQLADWRGKGLSIPSIAVNLSPTNFHNLTLPQTIADALRLHGLRPGDLTLEITEGVLVDVNPSILQTLDDIYSLGVRLAMDDFGTGYSSLSYLRRLPISELKLDKSFVDDLDNDSSSRALSDAVINIGQSLELTVVAEGIETLSQYEILRQQGYHVAQGYLFSRPLPAAQLENWMAERRP